MKTTKKTELYRGDRAGAFTGPNGYYAARMATDGVSHYQPMGGGNGWSDRARDEANESAAAMDLDLDSKILH